MSGTELSPVENPNLDPQPPPPETELNTEERQLTPRERMMADIARRAQEAREREEAQGAVYETEARDRGEALPADEPEEPQPQEAAPEPVPAAEPEPQPQPQTQLRQINIGGQLYTVTDEQLANLAQVGVHALLPQPQAQQPPQSAPAPEPPPQRAAVDPAKLSEVVQKMQFGSADEARDALGAFVQDIITRTPASPQIDRNEIVAQATREALAAHQLQRDTETIRAEFPRVFSDPRLAGIAHQTVQMLQQQDATIGRVRPAIDIYREAGNQVYDLIGQPRPGSDAAKPPAIQAAPVVRPRTDVEERKRAAPRNPQPVDRRMTPPATPRPPTPSEIVAKMREARHQAAMN